jgi:hypothetical protein
MSASTVSASTQLRLREAAETAVATLLSRRQRVAEVASELSPFSTSFRIEDVTASLESGQLVHLVRKDLSWETMLDGARSIRSSREHDPRREIDVYRELLPLAPAGPPRLLADSGTEGPDGLWLMLERIVGVQLRHVGEASAWAGAARWTGAFHAAFASPDRIAVAEALGLPRLVADRMHQTFVSAVREIHRRTSPPVAAAAVRAIARSHPRVVQRLAKQHPTLIHGQLYPSNIIVSIGAGRRRIAVLDWETAAIGPGVVDLAALVEGQWTAEQRTALIVAYLLGRDGAAVRSTIEHRTIVLECAPIHLCLDLLALPAEFDPPADQTADWLDLAVRLAGEVAS